MAVECSYKLHVDLGPGLLESVYEALLARSLSNRGLKVDRQKPIRIRYQDVTLEEGFRVDLLVEDRLVIELKSTERHMPVHAKQLLTYLRLMNLPIGLLRNFGAPTFKAGCRRIVNNHTDFAASRLRVHQFCTAGNGRGSPSIHGGAVMTFADVLGAFGGFANLPEGSNGTTTSESKTNFLSAAPEGSTVYGEATPFKIGRRQSVWQTKITLEDGTLVAVVTQTQIVL